MWNLISGSTKNLFIYSPKDRSYLLDTKYFMMQISFGRAKLLQYVLMRNKKNPKLFMLFQKSIPYFMQNIASYVWFYPFILYYLALKFVTVLWFVFTSHFTSCRVLLHAAKVSACMQSAGAVQKAERQSRPLLHVT